MITQVRPDVRHVPLNQIDLRHAAYRFRLPDPSRESTLRYDLNQHGQIYPLTLVERSEGSYFVVDGFSRVRALADEPSSARRWERIMAHVIPHQGADELSLFRRLCISNLSGPFTYRTYEKALFFSHFHSHLPISVLADESRHSIHEVEDSLELAKAPPSFGELINDAALPVLFGLMLFRRYQAWIRQVPVALANHVARQVIQTGARGDLDVKHWRFYLDFFWGRGRPFMSSYSR